MVGSYGYEEKRLAEGKKRLGWRERWKKRSEKWWSADAVAEEWRLGESYVKVAQEERRREYVEIEGLWTEHAEAGHGDCKVGGEIGGLSVDLTRKSVTGSLWKKKKKKRQGGSENKRVPRSPPSTPLLLVIEVLDLPMTPLCPERLDPLSW